MPPVCEQLLRLMKAGPGAGPAFFNLFGGFMGSDQIARLAGLVAFGVLGFYVELPRPVAEMLAFPLGQMPFPFSNLMPSVSALLCAWLGTTHTASSI